jgi:hypothetical protein
MPVLNELQTKHANDLVILGISLDGVADEHGHLPGHEAFEEAPHARHSIQNDVLRAAASRHLQYRILLDPENKIGARFNDGELPTNVLIDSQRRFSRRFIGARKMEAFEAIVLATTQSQDKPGQDY